MIVKKNSKIIKKVCFGMTNLTADGYFIPFLDYDDISLKRVETDLLNIQKKFNLSDIYIIKSSNGYNALSLDKLPYNVMISLVDYSKIVDKVFRKVAIARGYFTLRIGIDKKIICILTSDSIYYEKSNSHLLALEKFYDIEVKNIEKIDKNTMLRIDMFLSDKYGFFEVEHEKQKL